MRILVPRFTTLLKGDLKISFYRVVEERFHKLFARVYPARGICAFFLWCVLFFFLFLNTMLQKYDMHVRHQR